MSVLIDLPRHRHRPAHITLHLVAGAVLLTTAVVLAVQTGTGLGAVLLFAVLPDAAFLLAIGQPHRPGQLAARAVPAYNLMHHPATPLALLVLSAAIGPYWSVAALTWLAHVAFDRAAGYGLRNAEGWQRA